MTKIKDLEENINNIKEVIFSEIDRRADKEWCLEDKRDFTVTITYEDYKELTDLEGELYELKKGVRND